jgi:copper(I)-binding protein
VTSELNFPASTVLRRAAALGAAGVLALGLAACGSDDSGADATTSAAAASEAASTSASGARSEDASQEDALTLVDGYVAAKTADKDMTAVFGELTNSTDKDIHLTKVTGDLDAVYQYHEVVDGVMRETADGLTIPANSSMTLEPGGHHIMIMENHDDIAAGDQLTLTLTAEDGAIYTLADIPVRVQQSGHEDYGTDGMDMGDMDGMDGMDGTESSGAAHETGHADDSGQH